MPVTVLRRHGRSTHRSARRGFRSAKRRSRVWDGRCLMSAGPIYKGRRPRPIQNKLPNALNARLLPRGRSRAAPPAHAPGGGTPFGPRDARRRQAPGILARYLGQVLGQAS